MKILLTGANGFVGSHFYKQSKGACLSVVRRNNDNNPKDLFIIDGIHSSTNWNGAFDDIDVVIHLAGLAHKSTYSDEEYVEVNTKGTLHLAAEASKAGVKRFVFISSIGVNGVSTQDECITEVSRVNPHNKYAESKLLAEEGLYKLSDETGLEVVIIRPPLVYGSKAPGNFSRLVTMVNKLPILPFGLTDNKRSFISVDNLANFIDLCAVHPKAKNETFVISDGKPISINQFSTAIAKGLGTFQIQLPVPVALMIKIGKLIGKSKMVGQLLEDLNVDSSKAKHLLDWSPLETMAEAMVKIRL